MTEETDTRSVVLGALSALRLTRCEDEEIRIAKMRLEEWLEIQANMTKSHAWTN